jgi:hypothetical protein
MSRARMERTVLQLVLVAKGEGWLLRARMEKTVLSWVQVSGAAAQPLLQPVTEGEPCSGL